MPGSTGAVVYIAHRQVAGLYTTALTSQPSKKNWKPHALTPLVDENGLIRPEWNRYLSDIGGRKLGGATFPTLPELTSFILLAQQNAQAVTAIQESLKQMTIANAQSTQSVIEVVQAAGLTGATQIPPPVLAPPETNIPSNPSLPDSPGGGD